MYRRIEGKIIALEPISHIGETLSVDSKFNRQKMIVDTKIGKKVIEVPIISGNALRGILRRKGAYRFLGLAGIHKSELSEYLQHALFSGGMLKKGAGGGVTDLQFIKKVREILPIVSLFGTVLGQQMIESKLDVGQLIPIACETKKRTGIHSEISVFNYLDEIAMTRKDDIEDKVKGIEEEQKQQMRYTIEVLSAGTEFYHYFTLKDVNEIEEGCFWSTLAEFMKYPKIGGNTCKGFGLIKMEYEVDYNKVEQYEKWVMENKLKIQEYIKKLEKIV